MSLPQGIHNLKAYPYHCDPCVEPSLSASIANVLLAQSPAHAWHQHPRLNPNYAAEEDSRFDLGSAAHSLLLERDGSSIEWIAADDWRTNAAKQARDEARNAGKLPVLAKFQPVLQRMVTVAREAVNASEFAGLFDSGEAEQTVVWQEPGVWCRARPDWLNRDQRICLDYKSAASAAPEQFIRQIGNMGYDVSAEFYLRGLHNVGLLGYTYVFLAQEIESPYACSLHTLGNAYREIAAEKVERAIATWRMCIQADRWPAYTLKLHHAEPPSWVMAEYEARMTTESGDWQ